MAAVNAPKTVRRLDPTILPIAHPIRFPKLKGKVIQGRLRQPNSRAAQNWRERESARLKKALQRLTHGKNIFVYNNARTNQVVYSFTRSLDRHHVLSQLIYHGRRTVPSSLRKDMWRPYFSMHFPTASIGLEAYRLLREFSVRRQLSPPEEMITVTEETLIRRRPRDPDEAEKWEKVWKRRVGQIMNKKQRARVLMDQKATSVADVAAVLNILREKEKTVAEAEVEAENTPVTSSKSGARVKKETRRRRQRVNEAWRKAKELEEKTRQQIKDLEDYLSQRRGPAEIAEPDNHNVAEGEVKMLWTDIYDAQWAESWPEHVVHGELPPNSQHIIGLEAVRARMTPSAAGREELAATQVVQQGAQAGADTVEESKPAKKSALERLRFWRN